MTQPENTPAKLIYFVICLFVLIVALRLIGGLLNLISQIVAAVLTLILIVAICYGVWLLIKAILNRV